MQLAFQASLEIFCAEDLYRVAGERSDDDFDDNASIHSVNIDRSEPFSWAIPPEESSDDSDTGDDSDSIVERIFPINRRKKNMSTQEKAKIRTSMMLMRRQEEKRRAWSSRKRADSSDIYRGTPGRVFHYHPKKKARRETLAPETRSDSTDVQLDEKCWACC